MTLRAIESFFFLFFLQAKLKDKKTSKEGVRARFNLINSAERLKQFLVITNTDRNIRKKESVSRYTHITIYQRYKI